MLIALLIIVLLINIYSRPS